MYRFKFMTQYGAWVIQIQVMHFFWFTVRNDNKDLQFNTFEDAQAYADAKGLPKHYRMQAAPKDYHAYMEYGYQR